MTKSSSPEIPEQPAAEALQCLPTYREATRLWFRIGCLSFGGPAGQIAFLHREVVDERNWISDRRFLNALNFCHLLPGPEAQQLAIYLGWLMHGALGGATAGLLFVIPGAIVMMGLSIIYASFGTVPFIAALFFGLKCAVLVMVVDAVRRIGKRALRSRAAWGLASLSFVALFLFRLPFPIVVLVSGIIGYLLPQFFSLSAHSNAMDGPIAAVDALLAADPGRISKLAVGARRAGLVAIALWITPVALLIMSGGIYGQIAWFFSKMALVTFGGAYAVLAYAAQEAVQHYHWLAPPEMLSGLGLAETTPGPLILVLQFVGFLAGYRSNGMLTGITGGIIAALLTLWVTFGPCFALVFLGAPFIERLQTNRSLSAALSAVTAAVVGVIANLAVWFAIHVFFKQTQVVQAYMLSFDAPVLVGIDLPAILIASAAAIAFLGLGLGMVRTLAICALLGVSARFLI